MHVLQAMVEALGSFKQSSKALVQALLDLLLYSDDSANEVGDRCSGAGTHANHRGVAQFSDGDYRAKLIEATGNALGWVGTAIWGGSGGAMMAHIF